MRKKRSKSAEIREVLAAEPGATNAQVVAKLAMKNIKVTPNHVATVRGVQKSSKGHAKNGLVKMPFVIDKVVIGSPIETVRKVKNLAAEVGGLRALRELVDAMAS